MATDIRHFTATFPAGNGSNAPSTFAVDFPVRTVSRIDWQVPPGHMGTMGWLLMMGGVPVLPVYGEFTYVVADGKDGTWEVADYPDSGAWQVNGFNFGGFPHSVLLTFHCDLPTRPAALRANLSPYDLMPSPDLSHAGPPVKGR